MRVVMRGPSADRPDVRRLAPFLRSLAERCPPRSALVEVNWIGERKMAALTRVYKRRPGTADILTFCYHGSAGRVPESTAGEIYLCWVRLRREATRRGVSPKAFAGRLLVHGLFHMRGHRHDTAAGEALMEAAERRFLRGELSRPVLERLFA